jgi:hypothetical protein
VESGAGSEFHDGFRFRCAGGNLVRSEGARKHRAGRSLRLLPQWLPSVHMSVNAARRSACATQNLIFAASCTNRGESALTTWPNAELVISPSTDAGPKNCA